MQNARNSKALRQKRSNFPAPKPNRAAKSTKKREIYRRERGKRRLNVKYHDASVKYHDVSVKYYDFSVKYYDVSVKYMGVSVKYVDASVKYVDVSVKFDDFSLKTMNNLS